MDFPIDYAKMKSILASKSARIYCLWILTSLIVKSVGKIHNKSGHQYINNWTCCGFQNPIYPNLYYKMSAVCGCRLEKAFHLQCTENCRGFVVQIPHCKSATSERTLVCQEPNFKAIYPSSLCDGMLLGFVITKWSVGSDSFSGISGGPRNQISTDIKRWHILAMCHHFMRWECPCVTDNTYTDFDPGITYPTVYYSMEKSVIF